MLRILHAAPYVTGPAPGLGRQRAEEILARAYTVAHRAEPDVPVSTRLTTEQPVESLLAASAETSLLVVGMGGLDPAGELIIGSPALNVSGRAGCPVIVTRGRWHPRDTYRPVLVGVDSVATDAAALSFAFADVWRHAGPLVALHARHGLGAMHDHLSGKERAAQFVDRAHLAEALAPWTRAYPDVAVELQVEPGHPSTALLSSAAHARLLVMGSRGRSAPARALFGSTSRELLRRCPTPVAVLPVGVSAEPIPGPVEPDQPVSPGTGLEQPRDLGRLS